MLDEYAHVLEESLGLMGKPPSDVVDGIAGEMLEALSIRTSPVRMDDIRCKGPGAPIDVDSVQHPHSVRASLRRPPGRTGREHPTRRHREEGVQLPLPAVHPGINLHRPGGTWISTPTATRSTTGICPTIPSIWSRGRAVYIATRGTPCARTWPSATVLGGSERYRGPFPIHGRFSSNEPRMTGLPTPTT